MRNEKDDYIIQRYRENEEMMILVYAQWCVNNDIDPKALYKQAYPEQHIPALLDDVLDSTVPKDESEKITDDTVIQILQVYGNDDLAFAIVEKKKTKKENP
ncbi:MAG TPA: hypothetical protein VK142_08380 [Bacillota bacterium]|nr:hypothetical protein [Bacillota bacterium]